MSYKISVIVPVYNCASYLERAIESVISQDDFNNYELILVDDGSIDESSLICDRYNESYSNIKVYHQKNSGVSVARNKGIELAEGEWIMFLDSDDYLSENVTDKFFKYGNADIFCGEYSSNKVTGSTFEKYFKSGIHLKSDINETLNLFLSSSDNFFYTCWAKLFKRSIIVDNNLKFPAGVRYAEDMVFVFTYLTYCKNLSLIDEDVYFYFVNESNATNVVEKSFEIFNFIFNWKTEYFLNLGISDNTVYDRLNTSYVFSCYDSIKTSATYIKSFWESVKYIKSILENKTFYERYVGCDDIKNFVSMNDKLLDRFIRQKNAVFTVVLFRVLALKSKLLR